MGTQIKLSENSWSCKLIKFVFNIEPTLIFNNLCPYFWITVLGVILFIPSLVIWPFRVYSRHKYSNYLKSLNKAQLFWLKYYPHHPNEYVQKYFTNTITLRYLEKDNDEIFKEALRVQGISEKKVDGFRGDWLQKTEELEQEFRETKQRVGKISFITKQIGTWIFILFHIFTGYLISTALVDFIFYIGSFNMHDINMFLLSLSLLFILSAYIYGIKESKKSIKNWKNIKGIRRYLYDIPLIIFYSPVLVIIYLWNELWKFSGIFGKYLLASYKDYCPGINWEIEK